jgi:predicted ester cyclase
VKAPAVSPLYAFLGLLSKPARVLEVDGPDPEGPGPPTWKISTIESRAATAPALSALAGAELFNLLVVHERSASRATLAELAAALKRVVAPGGLLVWVTERGQALQQSRLLALKEQFEFVEVAADAPLSARLIYPTAKPARHLLLRGSFPQEKVREIAVCSAAPPPLVSVLVNPATPASASAFGPTTDKHPSQDRTRELEQQVQQLFERTEQAERAAALALAERDRRRNQERENAGSDALKNARLELAQLQAQLQKHHEADAENTHRLTLLLREREAQLSREMSARAEVEEAAALAAVELHHARQQLLAANARANDEAVATRALHERIETAEARARTLEQLVSALTAALPDLEAVQRAHQALGRAQGQTPPSSGEAENWTRRLALELEAPPDGAPSTSPGAPDGKGVARRVFLELFNQHRLELAEELFARSYVFHDPPRPPTPSSPSVIRERTGRRLEAFPDLRIELLGQVAEADRVATLFVSTATHRGEFLGIPATQRGVTLGGINVFRVEAGRIVERWETIDDLSLMLRRVPPELRALADAVEARVAGTPSTAKAACVPSGAEISATELKDLNRRVYTELFTGVQLELADQLFADGYAFHPISRSSQQCSRSALKDRLGERAAAFPDLAFTLEDQIAERDLIVTRFTVRGTHRGPLLGVAPSGKTFCFTGMGAFRVRGGRIVDHWEKYDEATLLAAMKSLRSERSGSGEASLPEPTASGDGVKAKASGRPQ